MKNPKTQIINVPEGEAIPLCSDLPSIHVRPPEHEVVDQALDALAKTGELFQRGHQLVRVVIPPVSASTKERRVPTIVPVNTAWLRLALSRAAEFVKVTQDEVKPVLVPDFVPMLALEKADFAGIPELYALAETPVFLSDGSIHCNQGLDSSTGLYYQPLGEAVSLVDSPTYEDATRAAEELFDLVSDFPFSAETGKAAWLALLLTVCARFAIDGPVPFWLIDANGESAGNPEWGGVWIRDRVRNRIWDWICHMASLLQGDVPGNPGKATFHRTERNPSRVISCIATIFNI